jgi:DNA-binding MarR family transcriptional regulator
MNDISGRAGDTLMMDLLHAATALQTRLEDALAAVNLSLARFGVLEQLALAEAPLALSELAARLSCVRSNVTQLVDKLEADGLVRRVDDPADRRSVLAELTAEGLRRHEAGARALKQVQSDFAQVLPDSDRALLGRPVRGGGAHLRGEQEHDDFASSCGPHQA